jgi:AcrR family transcriptional regulator
MNDRRHDVHVLEAARRTVERFGLQGATLERIAEEAGLSRTTLHRRGVSKDQVVARLTEDAAEAYRRALWPALTSPGSGRERLTEALTAICRVAEENLELLLALGGQTDEVFHEDEGGEQMTRSDFTAPLERLLRDGAADGSLRELDPTEYATVIFNLVGWTYIHLRARHHWGSERAERTTLDVALNGLVHEADPAEANASPR